jgi:hypothetical protein
MKYEAPTSYEALYVLGTCLTEDEKEELVAIRHQLSEKIDWGNLVSSMKAELMCLIDGVISDGTCSREIPFDHLRETEQDFLNGEHDNGDTRKRFVMLLLIKKLLGALKQDVGKTLDRIVEDTLDYEDEVALKRVVDQGAEDEVEVSAVIAPQEDGTICFHLHKTVRKIPADGKTRKVDVLQTQCRKCGEDIGKPRICRSHRFSDSATTPVSPKTCQHSEAEWEEGSEGQKAICFDCGEEAPDPGKYKWADVGLEPYGDVPDEDELEVIINSIGGEENV